MTITYFTIENINSGLFRNQVINKLVAILNSSDDIKFEIIVFNSPLTYSANKKLLKSYKSELPKRLKIRYYAVLPPLRYVLSSVVQSQLIIKWLRFALKFIKLNGDLIHCRSYWPAILALKESDIPVLFDVRSLYPAESVAAGKLKMASKEYLYWSDLEKYCFKNSKGISVVSKPMVNYVEKIANNKIIDYNPIIVNTDQIFYDKVARQEFRAQLGWNNQVIFTYSGSFGYNGLNKPSLALLIKTILNANSEYRLLFLSSDPITEIWKFIDDNLIDRSLVHITEAKDGHLRNWLSASDIGLHALPNQPDSDTRLGTKVVEYWANGLPVILNENVGAAIDIINSNDVGFVLNSSNNMDNDDLNLGINNLLKLDREAIGKFGKDMFSAEKIAKQYIDTYKKCIGIK